MLRKLMNKNQATRPNIWNRGRASIGFFLHTPFPSYEVYQKIPFASELLLGISNSDLVGFHIKDYTQNFLSCCNRIANLPTQSNGFQFGDRHVSVDAFPVGIEPVRVQEKLQEPSVQARIKALKESFGKSKVILGVDRLEFVV
ncbi:hypothetical protein O181_028963 [Austropuccinia psidii MF-1]|uniref:Trehalose-6-phosphate synthase n=1 Tax=Austropuccinia psidii MF-1 TaxID=1389203 RepID=A0A9Q3H2B6_9BASI|nr:hypothetical protein [Austropuccinia psidii MF-1]